MNLRLENFVLLLWVATDFGRTVLSFDSRCPMLHLVSGRSRYQWRGRSVRFSCMRSFQLVGVKYAICMNGKWDADVPICVKTGCRVPSATHVNGQFIESYRGAVVKIVCNPGYSLIGPPSVYCNGVRWNKTFPVCRVPGTTPDTECQFEEENLCGWSQDPMLDFQWKRRNSLPRGALTNTSSSTGFYMYIESSNLRSDNETVRLFSPVYPPKFSNGTCFKFSYRMFGNATAFLKVYVKPEGVELWNIIPSFWMTGDYGNNWIQNIFAIDTMETPFQIVFEGVRGPGAVGDTAIDDVKLSQEECAILKTMTTTTESSESTTNTDDDIKDYMNMSCQNRCNEEKTDESNMDICHCYETCDRDGNCCADYFHFCTTFASTTTHSDVKVSTPRSSPPTLPSIEPELNFPSPKSPPKHYNNESNEILPEKPLLPRVPAFRPNYNETSNDVHGAAQPETPPKSTTPPPRTKTTTSAPRSKTTTSTPQSKTTTSTPRSKTTTSTPRSKTTTSTPQSKTTTMRKDTNLKTAVNGTKRTNEKTPVIVLPKPAMNRTKNEKVPANGTEVKTVAVAKYTSVTSPSTATTAARVFKSPNLNNIKLSFLDKPTRPPFSNEFRFTNGKPKEFPGKESPQAIKIDKGDSNSGIPTRHIIEFGGTGVAILVFIILGIFWYKRRSKRKTERENMVEDSDVRFLTSDEVLDFTLARPADDDL